MANGCGCPLQVEFAGGGRPQVSTSCKMNDRPAELSDIVDQNRDFVLFPLGYRKLVQFSNLRVPVIIRAAAF